MNRDEYIQELLKHYLAVKAFAIRKYKITPYDADDLVQDTFEKALKIDIPKDINIKHYLFRMLDSIIITSYRKSNTIKRTPKNINLTVMPNIFNDGRYILNYISRLPKRYMRAFYLHLIGYTYEEITKILNNNLPIIRDDIYKARQILKQGMSIN